VPPPRTPSMEAAEANPSNWLLTHQHPARCGRPGKWYFRYDMVSPIVDSMTMLHNSCYGFRYFEQFKKTSSKYARRSPFDASHPFVEPHHKKALSRQSLCLGCGTSDRRKFTIDSNNFMVCECGVVAGQNGFGVDYKETHSTEGSSARADAPRKSSDFFSATGPARHKPAQASVVSNAVRGGMGYALEMEQRAADRTETLDKRSVNKLGKVMKYTFELLEALRPLPEPLQRQIRMRVDKIFRSAAKHNDCCNSDACMLTLYEKASKTIAVSSVIYAFDQICNKDGVEGVTHQTLVAVHQRIQDSQVLNVGQNSSQHNIAMITTLDTQDVEMVCRPVEREEATTPVKGALSTAMKRQRSDLQSSPMMQIRDAITSVSRQCGYQQRVRDAALACLHNATFAASIKNNLLLPDTMGTKGTAQVLLLSVAEKVGAPGLSSLENTSMGGPGVMRLVETVKVALPGSVFAGGTSCDDDSLY
jgi:hypothetical protein